MVDLSLSQKEAEVLATTIDTAVESFGDAIEHTTEDPNIDSAELLLDLTGQLVEDRDTLKKIRGRLE
jgi:hypothetical protein